MRANSFCGIIPPHILKRLADRGHEPARHTLVLDERHRAARLEAVAAPPAAPQRLTRTIDSCDDGTDLPGKTVRKEGGAKVADGAVDRAYDALGATFAFYQKVYGRNSVDNNYLPLLASVHYGEDYDNAFWNGSQMIFGDGDKVHFGDFTSSVDVIGHELTHGVTQYSAGLAYQDQSGALNESVSDIFGSMIKQYTLGETSEQADWLIGEGLLLHGGALRSMKAPGTAYDDPELGKDQQPANMANYVQTTKDNGGVHINSGIPNHAFYLLAMNLGGHSWEQAGQIWYDTLTNGNIKPNIDFAGFAQATVTAAKARFNGTVGAAVADAWSQVGVNIAQLA